MTSVLEMTNVAVSFRGRGRGERWVRAVSGVSFAVAPGETLGIVGESGSGKSTTASVALALRRPDEGSVLFQGRPFPRKHRARAGRIQAVLQHPQWSLDPRMRVGASIAESLQVTAGGRASAHRDRIAEAMESVRLDPGLSERFPHELSGGQQQRVAIARALITDPDFIVFDEAVSALDVSVQRQVLDLVRRLQAEKGFAALFI